MWDAVVLWPVSGSNGFSLYLAPVQLPLTFPATRLAKKNTSPSKFCPAGATLAVQLPVRGTARIVKPVRMAAAQPAAPSPVAAPAVGPHPAQK